MVLADGGGACDGAEIAVGSWEQASCAVWTGTCSTVLQRKAAAELLVIGSMLPTGTCRSSPALQLRRRARDMIESIQRVQSGEEEAQIADTESHIREVNAEMKDTRLSQLKEESLASSAAVAFIGALLLAQSWEPSGGVYELPFDMTIPGLHDAVYFAIAAFLFVSSFVLALASIVRPLRRWVLCTISLFSTLLAFSFRSHSSQVGQNQPLNYPPTNGGQEFCSWEVSYSSSSSDIG